MDISNIVSVLHPHSPEPTPPPPLRPRINCSIAGCKSTFSRKADAIRHLRTHDDIRPYACETCPSRFRQRAHLTSHRRKHTGQKPYVCDICTKAFAEYSSHCRHCARHRKDGLWACIRCTGRFSTRDDLVLHIHSECSAGLLSDIGKFRNRISTSASAGADKKPDSVVDPCLPGEPDSVIIKGEVGSESYDPTTSDISKVPSRQVMTSRGRRYQCLVDNCGKDFKSEKYLLDHFRKKHGDQLACPYPGCGRTFSREKYLQIHFNEHPSPGPSGTYSCQLCPETFERLQGLHTHIKSHTQSFLDEAGRDDDVPDVKPDVESMQEADVDKKESPEMWSDQDDNDSEPWEEEDARDPFVKDESV